VFFLLFVSTLLIVNPAQASVSNPDSAKVFGEQHMSAAMVTELNVTVPEGDGYYENGSQIIKITFSFMMERVDEDADSESSGFHVANERVTPNFAESKAASLYNTSAPIYRANTWKNESGEFVNYTDVDIASYAAVKTTGYKYTGLAPSPEQLGLYACYLLGYTFNQVEDAWTEYETGTGQRVEHVQEQRTFGIVSDEDFEDGLINPNESEADLQENGELIKYSMPFQMELEGHEDAVEPITIAVVLIALAIIAICAAVIVHDLTGHAAQEELAAAYAQGYEAGADAQAMADKESIRELYDNGSITKEQMDMLLNKINNNNADVKANFTNPYSVGTYNRWSNILIQVMQTVIIIIGIIVLILVAVGLYKKFGKKKNEKTSGVTVVAAGGMQDL